MFCRENINSNYTCYINGGTVFTSKMKWSKGKLYNQMKVTFLHELDRLNSLLLLTQLMIFHISHSYTIQTVCISYLSHSLSFSRTFWDSSRRSCRALSLLESSSAVLMSSHSCLLRSCRLRPEDERELAMLTPPLQPRLSQAS